MAQFLMKVNATRCPAGVAQPTTPSDWNNGWFDLTCPTRRFHGPPPAAFDYCLIWVNELPRDRVLGEGLVAAAIIQAVRGNPEPEAIQIFSPQLFRSPPVNRHVIQQYEHRFGRGGTDHIIIRAHYDRHRTLYHLTDSDFTELLRPNEHL